MKIAVVTPTWQNASLTLRCFKSVWNNLDGGSKLVWIDNASDHNNFSPVYSLANNGKTIIVRNARNYGYVKGTNQGIRIGMDFDAVLLLNSDTEMYPGCIDRLAAHLSHSDIVSPLSNYSYVTNLVRVRSFVKDLPEYKNNGESYDRILRDKYPRKYVESDWVTFFCALIKKEVFEKIGLLDEDFKLGYGDDGDYCYRAIKSGFKISVVLDTFVFHDGGKTFSFFECGDGTPYRNSVHDHLRKKHPDFGKLAPPKIIKG
jgi:GT2 family glycosyltransferase